MEESILQNTCSQPWMHKFLTVANFLPTTGSKSVNALLKVLQFKIIQ